MKRFYTPTQVITGCGCLAETGHAVRGLGDHVLLVCGARSARASGLLDKTITTIEAEEVRVTVYDAVRGEAELPTVEEGIALARAKGCDVYVGLGGGSAMDTAKAIAGLVSLPGKVWEYHAGRKLHGPAQPLLTIPTTAGTGAEVTKNAVLLDPRQQVKQSIRDDSWFARVALVDPELTVSMPPETTASSGADALCQAIESYTSLGASPITDALASEAIARIGNNLVRAYKDGHDLQAREAVAMGSLMAGMAMASARLGGVHGMAHPLGAYYHIPHGTVCGLLLPYTMAYNLPAAGAKYARVATLMGLDTQRLGVDEAAHLAVEHVRDTMEAIGIPLHLGIFGVRADQLDPIIEGSLPSGSLKHNPRTLGAEDVRNILLSAM